MKYYLAPMEGITGFIYRNAYEKFFHNIDKYFTQIGRASCRERV